MEKIEQITEKKLYKEPFSSLLPPVLVQGRVNARIWTLKQSLEFSLIRTVLTRK